MRDTVPTQARIGDRGAPAAARGSILVVEDERDLADVLRFNLEREGYTCRTAAAGDEALEAVRAARPDLIVLDRMLPGLSGDEVLARLKQAPTTAAIPVVMLTAKVEEGDQLAGFALGADDYITKPFAMKVFLARVAAVIRRAAEPAPATDTLTVGAISLVPSRHEVTVGDVPVKLTLTEFKLLRALLAARGRVLTRAELLDRVVGPGIVVTDRTIDVHITALRRKLRSEARWIKTVRGVGYTLRSA